MTNFIILKDDNNICKSYYYDSLKEDIIKRRFKNENIILNIDLKSLNNLITNSTYLNLDSRG